MLRRIAREPLLHFVVLGALLFALYVGMGRGGSASVQDIVVSRTRIAHLANMFSRSWRREPREDELNELISDYVREEVFYREAKAMGLDSDDPVIRRRLRQKLEFLQEDVVALRMPTDDELGNLLQSEPERYRIASRYSFEHVFLDTNRDRDHLAERQDALRRVLAADSDAADPLRLGDRFLLGQTFADVPAHELGRLFGEDFAGQLVRLPLGSWEGPVRSPYGLHFVRLTSREGGRLASLDEARPILLREWSEHQRVKASTEAFARLRSHYRVVIESASEPSRGRRP